MAPALNVVVPPDWPPDYLADALPFFADQIAKDPTLGGWGMWFVIGDEPPPATAPRTLIGTAGCKSRPTPDGSVEVGYGIVNSRHRQGFATEALRGLLGWVFADPRVCRALAHTFERHDGSVGVLRNTGFRVLGPGTEKVDESERQGRGELLLFELPRSEWERRGAPSRTSAQR